MPGEPPQAAGSSGSTIQGEPLPSSCCFLPSPGVLPPCSPWEAGLTVPPSLCRWVFRDLRRLMRLQRLCLPRGGPVGELLGPFALAGVLAGLVTSQGWGWGLAALMARGLFEALRHRSPSQELALSSVRVSVPSDRTWTTSTTAKTAGSSTCWTSATWRAGECLGQAARHPLPCHHLSPRGRGHRVARRAPLLVFRAFITLHLREDTSAACACPPTARSPVPWGTRPGRVHF